jgi:Rod binding domain-containing protein
MGGTTHKKWQNSGHEVAIHAYKLWQRHLDHRLSATLEHARDFGLKDLVVPRLLHLVGGSAKCQIKVTNTPAIPRMAQVAVPKRVHLLTCGASGVLCSIVRNTVYCNDIVTY